MWAYKYFNFTTADFFYLFFMYMYDVTMIDIIHVSLIQSAEKALSGEPTDFGSNSWSEDCWFYLQVRIIVLPMNWIFACGHMSLQLKTHTHSEWLEREESNNVYCFETRVREKPFDIYGGGGQEDLSEPENFFCLFLEQDNFFRRPFGPDYFFITSQSSFHKTVGGSTSRFFIYQNFFSEFFFPEILPFYNAKSHFPSIMYFWSE